MALPALPTEGQNWAAWGGAVHNAVNAAASQTDLTAASTTDRARANHTGTQPASTITGLAAVATSGAYADLTGKPTVPTTAAELGAVPTAGDSTVTGNKTFSGGITSTSITNPLRSSTFFGLGAGVGSARMPFYQNSIINAPDIANTLAAGGGDDYVAHQINARFQGGFASLIQTRTGSMTSGSATLTLTTGTFTDPITVGYAVVVPGAGTAGGTLKARITAITDTTHATLSVAAGTTVSGATVTASLAADPAFLFGSNEFYRTGLSAGDLSGITSIFGKLTEVHIDTPSTPLTTVKGSVVEVTLESTATGSSATTVYGQSVTLTNRGTATVGTAYAQYIESPTLATTNWALYVNGSAPTFLGGLLVVGGDIQNSGSLVNVYAGASSTVGAKLQLRANTVDGFANLALPNAGAKFTISDGTTVMTELRNSGEIISKRVVATATSTSAQAIIAKQISGQTVDIFQVQDFNTNAMWAVNATGIPRWTATANQQTTVGAAGGASALPAAPVKYLKVQDSAGTTYVIPAYNA